MTLPKSSQTTVWLQMTLSVATSCHVITITYIAVNETMKRRISCEKWSCYFQKYVRHGGGFNVNVVQVATRFNNNTCDLALSNYSISPGKDHGYLDLIKTLPLFLYALFFHTCFVTSIDLASQCTTIKNVHAAEQNRMYEQIARSRLVLNRN